MLFILIRFLPSSGYERTEDQLAEPSSRAEKNRDERDNQADRTQRFGITGYGGTVSCFDEFCAGISSRVMPILSKIS